MAQQPVQLGLTPNFALVVDEIKKDIKENGDRLDRFFVMTVIIPDDHSAAHTLIKASGFADPGMMAQSIEIWKNGALPVQLVVEGKAYLVGINRVNLKVV